MHLPNKETLDWLEKAATEHLKGRLATADLLLTQANQLLNLTLAGMAGALAYGAKVFEPNPSAMAWGAATTAVWLMGCAILLTLTCIRTRLTYTLHNEPRHLNQPGFPLDTIRAHEVENMQGRIDATKTRNEGVARWLDRCSYAVAAAPLPFTLGAWLGC